MSARSCLASPGGPSPFEIKLEPPQADAPPVPASWDLDDGLRATFRANFKPELIKRLKAKVHAKAFEWRESDQVSDGGVSIVVDDLRCVVDDLRYLSAYLLYVNENGDANVLERWEYRLVDYGARLASTLDVIARDLESVLIAALEPRRATDAQFEADLESIYSSSTRSSSPC